MYDTWHMNRQGTRHSQPPPEYSSRQAIGEDHGRYRGEQERVTRSPRHMRKAVSGAEVGADLAFRNWYHESASYNEELILTVLF